VRCISDRCLEDTRKSMLYKDLRCYAPSLSSEQWFDRDPATGVDVDCQSRTSQQRSANQVARRRFHDRDYKVASVPIDFCF
jgi:hypothetical protein